MSDLLQPSPGETLIVDPPHDRRFRFVHAGDRVLAARTVALALQAIAIAAPAGDAPVAHARPQRFSRARPDGFKLHLVAGALDEGGGLIDRIPGVDLSVIALWLGHQSPATTMVYLHSDVELKRRVMEKTSGPTLRFGKYHAGDRLLTFLKDLSDGRAASGWPDALRR